MTNTVRGCLWGGTQDLLQLLIFSTTLIRWYVIVHFIIL